jgi:peptidoglycan DL-endopeptidase CwlO
MKPILVEARHLRLRLKSLLRKDLSAYGWGWKSDAQWQCLLSLWTKESNWRPNAYNKTPVYQKGEKLNAGGIPQILGLNPKISVEEQINRGFTYIESRYSDPCSAWRFWERNNWY